MHGQHRPPARKANHLFVGSLLCVVLGFTALGFGVVNILEALDNPHPTIVRCEERALRSVGPDVWTELTECAADIDNAFELYENHRLTHFYIPLFVPQTGAPVGVFATDDSELIHLLRKDDAHRSAENLQAAYSRLDELLEPPLRGFTRRTANNEQGISRHAADFGPADILLEHGQQPRMGLGVLLLGVALVLFVYAAVLALRVKRGWDAELAAWQAQHTAPPQPGNP